jgi:hypothetical protein
MTAAAVLGMPFATAESVAAWNEIFTDLIAGGLTAVRPVTSDAHAAALGHRGEAFRDKLAAALTMGSIDGRDTQDNMAGGQRDDARHLRVAAV